MIFEDLRRHKIPYTVIRYRVGAFGYSENAWQVIADYTPENAVILAGLGFNRFRLTAYRRRYVWRNMTRREASYFARCRYTPTYADNLNAAWEFNGGVKKRRRKSRAVHIPHK